jgi:sugar/nucleoside kinase (ribokinase family)
MLPQRLSVAQTAPDLITSVADDWLGRMFLDMATKYAIPIHPRQVKTSSLSFIMPNDGKRAIVRCRDDDYLGPFPVLDLTGCRALHVDGHQADAAFYYAKRCRNAGILTSLDGGGVRSNTHELLAFIDVAVVAERLCEQMRLTPYQMLDYLKTRGCRIGGVTSGEKGLLRYDESGLVRLLTALPVPIHRIVDTSGAGDVFHGAYVHSYLSSASGLGLERPFSLCPRSGRLQNPAPRKRGGLTRARRHRSTSA